MGWRGLLPAVFMGVITCSGTHWGLRPQIDTGLKDVVTLAQLLNLSVPCFSSGDGHDTPTLQICYREPVIPRCLKRWAMIIHKNISININVIFFIFTNNYHVFPRGNLVYFGAPIVHLLPRCFCRGGLGTESPVEKSNWRCTVSLLVPPTYPRGKGLTFGVSSF